MTSDLSAVPGGLAGDAVFLTKQTIKSRSAPAAPQTITLFYRIPHPWVLVKARLLYPECLGSAQRLAKQEKAHWWL